MSMRWNSSDAPENCNLKAKVTIQKWHQTMRNTKVKVTTQDPPKTLSIKSTSNHEKTQEHKSLKCQTAPSNHKNASKNIKKHIAKCSNVTSNHTDFYLSPGCFGTDIIQKCTKWSQIGIHGLKIRQIFSKCACVSFLVQKKPKRLKNVSIVTNWYILMFNIFDIK